MNLFYVYPPVAVAQAAFMAWMLFDAHRRQADPFWFWVILSGVGAWVYFFSIKAPELHRQGGISLAGLFQRPASVEELRYRAEEAPTLANHLALAERLMAAEQHAEAVPHLEAARKIEPEHCQVLFSLAVCRCTLGTPDQALPLLEAVIRVNPSWSGGAAWHLLVRAQADSGDRAGALETCRRLARQMPTLEHCCLLAEHLLAAGQAEEAGQVLDQALRSHAYSPGPIRRMNRRWAGVARRLQKQVTVR